MKKSVSMVLLLLVMILSISAVSAADMDLDPELALPDSDVSIGASDEEVLADEGSNDFTSLQNSIDGGSTLLLTSDYKRVDGDSDVSITKDVTIIGNNHKIDADKKGGIFKVNTGCTLTLIGVTLINGNNENGGAIYNEGGVLNIVNSQLINNTATKSGGAIYNTKYSSIYVSGSTFDGNDLTDRNFNGWGGAAIYNDGGSIIMDDCRVTNNLKNIVHRGGTGNYTGDLSSAALASYDDGSVSITNSYFANNSGSYGGAILFYKGVLDIKNTAFENNFAFNGGAIDIIDGSYTISNCTFKGNTAKGTGSTFTNYAHGGALCIVYETAGECVISDCIFKDNSAAYGGAVSNSNAKFVDCTFINNTASASNSETFNGVINSRGGVGGAIYSDKQITVIDSNFTNNTSRFHGLYIKNADISGSSFNNSAIYVARGTIDVNDNEDAEIFCGLNGKVNIGSGEIPSVKSGTVYYAPTSFADLQTLINNCASKIMVTCDVTKLANEEETFANGITVAKSITIDMLGHTITSNNGKVFNIAKDIALTLINANVVGDGNVAIYNEGELKLSLSNPSTFDNFGDYAIDNNGVLYKGGLTTFTQLNDLINLVNGGEIQIFTSKITQTEEEKDNFANGILINKDLNITGRYNKDILAKIDAAKYSRIFNVVDGATLTLNKIILSNGNADKGAGVYVDEGASLVVNVVKFINNTAVTRGGAIYSEGNVAVNKAIFDGNDVTFRSKNVDNGGAAIYALGGKLTVADSNFTNNLKDYVVRGTDGKTGDLINAIITTSAVTEITGSRFVNNSGCYGGAIYAAVIDGVGTPSLVIRDSKFVNNTAYAGTIHIEDIEYEISDSVFDGNKALGYGSVGYTAAGAAVTAMYPGANGLVTNCTFTNNRVSSTATPKGGAIVAQNGKIRIVDSKFENNSVFGSELAYGGAICGDSSVEMIIEKSNFTNNAAAKGGAIYSDGKSLSVSNSNFKDNKGIGTIYNNAELTLAGNKIESTDFGIINDKGTVTTTINAIFLENKTLSAELGDVVELRATLTDDNGNAIKDYNFKFSVNGKTIGDITFDDGVYTTEYIIENAGEIVISTDYVADNLVKLIGIYEVPKAHITEFKVYVNKNEFEVGETVTVNVILRGVNDLGLNGDVVVILNNVPYTVKVNNGIGSFDVSGLVSNTYAAFAFFNGDDNYIGPVFDNVIFKVMEPDYIISISVDDNVKVGDDATVKVSIPGASGVVKIIVDGAGTIITLDETGKAEYIIPNIAAGEHSIITIYDGDETHNAVYNSAVLNVAKFASEVSVAGGNVVVGQDTVIKVSVTDGATGVVMIEVAGAYYSLDLSESDEISISLPVGEYSVVAKYMGDDKFDSSVSSPITVVVADKQVAHITIEAADVKVGEDATVSVSIPGASGVVKIIVDGVESVVDLDDDGKVSHVVSGLAAGEHSIVVVYDGDANYKGAHDSAVLKVAKFASEVAISPNVAGQNIVIDVDVSEGATGLVLIKVGDIYYALDLSKSNKLSLNLPAGEYAIVANYGGDDKFNPSESSPITIVVKDKQVTPITLNVADIKVGETGIASITLAKDATGSVVIFVDGKKVDTVDVVDGNAIVLLSNLSAGNHVVEAKYSGDENYASVSDLKTMSVSRIDTVIVVDATFTRVANDWSAGERGALFYAVLKDANGNPLVNKTVQIAVNGPIYNVTTDEYGRAGLQINLAAANTYTYALSFQGDDMYNAAPIASSKLILTKKATTIKATDKTFKSTAKTKTVSVQLTTSKNPYDGKTYLSAGKKITLKVNGKTYTAKTDKNGIAKFNINLTKKGKYTASIKFAGDNTYKGSSKSIKITIK